LNASPEVSGRYQLRVWNEYGEETALVDVVVATAPGRPCGPLRIDDVSSTGCTCSWKEPEDDGGSQIIHYVAEKATKSTGWTPCGKTALTYVKITGAIITLSVFLTAINEL